ncbi:MAG: hypothetical protein ABMB14_29555, partial [Myxococcota bacterium]
LRRQLPIGGGGPRWDGVELHLDGAPCPDRPARWVQAPCAVATPAALDAVYRAARAAVRCGAPTGVADSPHAPFRSVTLRWDGDAVELVDDAGAGFQALADAIAAAAGPRAPP